MNTLNQCPSVTLIVSSFFFIFFMYAGKNTQHLLTSTYIPTLSSPDKELTDLKESDDPEINDFLNDRESTKGDRWALLCVQGKYIEVLEEHYKYYYSNHRYEHEYASEWRDEIIQKYVLLPFIWCDLMVYKNKKDTSLEETKLALKKWLLGLFRILLDQATCNKNCKEIEYFIQRWKKRFLECFDSQAIDNFMFDEELQAVIQMYQRILFIDQETSVKNPHAQSQESMLPHPELILLLQSPKKKYRINPWEWKTPTLYMKGTLQEVSNYFPKTLGELTQKRSTAFKEVIDFIQATQTELLNSSPRRSSPLKNRPFYFY